MLADELALTSQYVHALCESSRLRNQLLDLADALREIAILPAAQTGRAGDIARNALAEYYLAKPEAK